MKKLTESQEDYLEEIYIQIKKNGSATVTDISKNLDVKKASVSGALNTLARKGLVNYAPYSQITLTEEGKIQAENVLKRHNTMALFFGDVLGLSEQEAVESACRIEHAMSDKLFEKAMKFYNILAEFSKKNPEFRKALDGLKE